LANGPSRSEDVGDVLHPIALHIDNDIPIEKGLGSSAAAHCRVVIRGSTAGTALEATPDLDEAAQIEGHPTMSPRASLGSIVASAIDAGGVARAVRLEAAGNL